jgi:hypothetical protein
MSFAAKRARQQNQPHVCPETQRDTPLDESATERVAAFLRGSSDVCAKCLTEYFEDMSSLFYHHTSRAVICLISIHLCSESSV